MGDERDWWQCEAWVDGRWVPYPLNATTPTRWDDWKEAATWAGVQESYHPTMPLRVVSVY